MNLTDFDLNRMLENVPDDMMPGGNLYTNAGFSQMRFPGIDALYYEHRVMLGGDKPKDNVTSWLLSPHPACGQALKDAEARWNQLVELHVTYDHMEITWSQYFVRLATIIHSWTAEERVLMRYYHASWGDTPPDFMRRYILRHGAEFDELVESFMSMVQKELEMHAVDIRDLSEVDLAILRQISMPMLADIWPCKKPTVCVGKPEPIFALILLPDSAKEACITSMTRVAYQHTEGIIDQICNTLKVNMGGPDDGLTRTLITQAPELGLLTSAIRALKRIGN
jgi:hypothetical protein